MTIIGGQIVYEDGRFTLVDEFAVMEEAQARADELFERLSLGYFRNNWQDSFCVGILSSAQEQAARQERSADDGRTVDQFY